MPEYKPAINGGISAGSKKLNTNSIGCAISPTKLRIKVKVDARRIQVMNFLPVGSVVFVMNVVIFAEHRLLMEEAVNPVEQSVFEKIEKYKLSGEFGPSHAVRRDNPY